MPSSVGTSPLFSYSPWVSRPATREHSRAVSEAGTAESSPVLRAERIARGVLVLPSEASGSSGSTSGVETSLLFPYSPWVSRPATREHSRAASEAGTAESSPVLRAERIARGDLVLSPEASGSSGSISGSVSGASSALTSPSLGVSVTPEQSVPAEGGERVSTYARIFGDAEEESPSQQEARVQEAARALIPALPLPGAECFSPTGLPVVMWEDDSMYWQGDVPVLGWSPLALSTSPESSRSAGSVTALSILEEESLQRGLGKKNSRN